MPASCISTGAVHQIDLGFLGKRSNICNLFKLQIGSIELSSMANAASSESQPVILRFIGIYSFLPWPMQHLPSQGTCKTLAHPRCKFFLWLTLLDRCWTAERLHWHQLLDSGQCAVSVLRPKNPFNTCSSIVLYVQPWSVVHSPPSFGIPK
jgi:hypothetical protein